MSDTPSKKLVELFDPNWYSNAYPDVAAAGVDPAVHYQNCGWKEGRWPCALEAVTLDNRLWSESTKEDTLLRLREIASDFYNVQQGLASWFLGRWHACWRNWHTAREYADSMLGDDNLKLFISHEGPFLLAFSIYFHSEDSNSALKILNNKSWLMSENKILAWSMLKAGKAKLATINQLFNYHNLAPISESPSATLDTISSDSLSPIALDYFSPLVSVIIPCYNAANTISTALDSLLRQSYGKLEIIVVDDASSDDTKSVIESYSQRDSRIRYLRLIENGGTYPARNAGLKLSKGQFITVHDADDWSHPQKIEKQVNILRSSRQIKAVLSHWVRTDHSLNFEIWRMDQGWIYRNVSSLMFRRSVFRKLGYWDNVSVNADTEYWLRIQKKFGPAAIKEVMPGVPLSFGRVDSGSLTQTSATHLRTQYAGIRKQYNDAAVAWHSSSRKLYMQQHGKRKFIAPPLICRGTPEVRKANLKSVLQSKGLFERAWYLTAYPDIAEAGVEPLTHFINHGLEEGRDPNPYLSVSGLAYISGKSNFDAISQWASEDVDKSVLYSIDSNTQPQSGKQLLMIAHLAGSELFGAERSFLDCVRMLHSQKANITVVLPSGVNRTYIEEIAQFASKIYFTPLPWWRQGRQEIAKVTEQICLIIKESHASVVYVNTLTLWEPHLAAKRCKSKSVTHVRELPNHDQDLCRRLNATPEQIREHIDACSGLVIANSKVTASFVSLDEKTAVVYNAIDSAKFQNASHKRTSPTLNVVMLSSNTIKKGIDDFFKIAKFVAEQNHDIAFFIYGPETPVLTARLNRYNLSNVTYCGYAEDPAEAYTNMDVVLNLSHFQESFGRTVVEGMSRGCIPVGYAWGALVEVIEPSYGDLVSLGKYQHIAEKLIALRGNKAELVNAQRIARETAENRFGHKTISKQLMAML